MIFRNIHYHLPCLDSFVLKFHTKVDETDTGLHDATSGEYDEPESWTGTNDHDNVRSVLHCSLESIHERVFPCGKDSDHYFGLLSQGYSHSCKGK